MPNTIQLQKAYGNLPSISLLDLKRDDLTVSLPPDTPDVETRQCGCPDAYDPEIEAADPDDLATLLDLTPNQCANLIEAHRRMGKAIAPGWGMCHDQTYYSVTYFLDLDTYPAHYKRPTTQEELDRITEAGVWRWTPEQLKTLFLGKPMIEVAAAIVDESYRVVNCRHIRVFTGPNGKHNVHLSAKRLAGSTIGLAYFPNGSCDDHVNHYEDTNYKPDLIGCCKLVCHEWGHNHGEEHQFAGQGTHHSVMSYDPPRLFYGFSTGEAPHVLPRDKSIDSLLRKYNGPTPPPLDIIEPEPEPPTDKDEFFPTDKLIFGQDSQGRPLIRNEFTRKGRRFIVAPRPFN